MTLTPSAPVLRLSDGTTAIVSSDGYPVLNGTTNKTVEAVQRTLETDWPSTGDIATKIANIGYENYMTQIQGMNLTPEQGNKHKYVARFLYVSKVLFQYLNFSGLGGSNLSALANSSQKYFSDKSTELSAFHEAISFCIRSDIFHAYVDRPIIKNGKVVDRPSYRSGTVFLSWEDITNRFNLIDYKFHNENTDYLYYVGLLTAAYTLMDKGNPNFIALPKKLGLEPKV